MHYRVQHRLQRLLKIFIYGGLAAALGVFLFIQMGASCYSYTAKWQKEKHCTCQGFEFTRSHGAEQGGTSSSVCFGFVKDRYISFVYWLRGGLAHSDRLIIQRGADPSPVLDAIDAKIIQRAGALFDQMNRNWRQLPDPNQLPPTAYTFVFYKYNPADSAGSPKPDIYSFGMESGFLIMPERQVRALSPEEETQIRALLP